MSPNEFQLRDALHDGEGDVPDASLAIVSAHRLRRARRQRITSIASAAAVVAVVAVGGTLLARSGSSDPGGGGGVAGALRAPSAQITHGGNPDVPARGNYSQRSAGSAQADGSGGTAKAFGIACPPQFPRQMLPGGGGTNQFAADQPLFGEPVATMKICVYGSGATLADSTVVAAPGATNVSSSLEAGSPSEVSSCPTTPVNEGYLAIYGVTSSGQQL